MRTAVFSSFFLFLAAPVGGIDNGIGLTPPMGWRSWNYFQANITQDIMQAAMDQMANNSRTVNGKQMSLKDLGYIHIGLDDNWQACGTGYNGSFHDEDGNPLVNRTTFPDMAAMTSHGHSKGLKVGWYGNNCICAEHQSWNSSYIAKHMERTVAAVAAYGFDGIKLDGCGQFRNLTWFAELFNATGRPIMIENCHWGQTVPGQTSGNAPCTGQGSPSDCPYNFFRTSGDIKPHWKSWFDGNLQSVIKYTQGPNPLSRPGTWAYPDMMLVGSLGFITDRTQFSVWCIISSPLILGHDILDPSKTDEIWEIVSNTELIAVNQDWAGHPGTLVTVKAYPEGGAALQFWSKPLSENNAAIMVINNSSQTVNATITFSDYGYSATAPLKVRDVYQHKDLGTFTGSFTTDAFPNRDSRFYRVSP